MAYLRTFKPPSIATPPFLPRVPELQQGPPGLGAPMQVAAPPPPPLPPPEDAPPPMAPPQRPPMPQLPERKEPGLGRKILAGALGGLAGWNNSDPRNRPIDVSGAIEDIKYPGYRAALEKHGLEQDARVTNSQIAENEARAGAERARGASFDAQANAKQAGYGERFKEAKSAGASDEQAHAYAAQGHNPVAPKPPAMPNTVEERINQIRANTQLTPEQQQQQIDQAVSDYQRLHPNDKPLSGHWEPDGKGNVHFIPTPTAGNPNPKPVLFRGIGHVTQTSSDRPDMQSAIEQAAQSLASGDLTRLREIASLRGDQRLLIFNRAKQLNPSFNTAEIDRKIKMEDYYTNGKGADNLRSFGIFLEHAGAASDAVNGIRLTASPIINRPLNWWRNNASGSPEYQRMIASLEPVRKELESFLLGGRALYAEDRKSAEVILNENSSPAQIQQALKTMAHTAKARFHEENFRYKRTMGRDLENALSPEAVSGAKAVGIDMFGSDKPTGDNNQGAPQQGMVRVRRKSDGKVGSMPVEKFNAQLYDKI